MKPSSTFKMSKTTKRMLSLFDFKDVHEKNSFKREMIFSQLYSEAASRSNAKNSKESDQA